jgi:hypothetical protein
MIKPIRSLSVDVVPQAIVNLNVKQIVNGFADIQQGNDDLDRFEGASFKLDNQFEIAIRHYSEHEENTATIYIDRRAHDVEFVSELIQKILKEFRIPPDAVRWERKNDPDL